MPKIIEHKLIEQFKDKESFSREDLFDFYLSYEPDLKEGTFAWRIFDLKNKMIIRQLKRSLYTISDKPKFKPESSNELIKLSKQISHSFKDVKYCIWETKWLNEFTNHQVSKRLTIIEVEKDFIESLFYKLNDSSRNEIFLNPDEGIIDFYIAESDNPVVIKKLITRSPIARRKVKRDTFFIPLLEKILVDIFAEEKLFYYLQGSELINIYENAIRCYAINFTKLFSYAKRREKEKDIKQFMTTHMHDLVIDIIE